MKYLVGGFCGVFMTEARRAVERAKAAAATDKTGEVGGATATAILLSCAGLEAALSEYITHLSMPVMMKKPLEEALVREWRDGNDPLYSRYEKLLGHYDSSLNCQVHDEFKDVRCLLQLRSHIAHRKAAFLPFGEWPERLANCKERIPYHRAGTHDWTSVLLVPAVAEWAVVTASTWLRWVEPRLPDVDVPPAATAGVPSST
jgi:hypothetical protein